MLHPDKSGGNTEKFQTLQNMELDKVHAAQQTAAKQAAAAQQAAAAHQAAAAQQAPMHLERWQLEARQVAQQLAQRAPQQAPQKGTLNDFIRALKELVSRDKFTVILSAVRACGEKDQVIERLKKLVDAKTVRVAYDNAMNAVKNATSNVQTMEMSLYLDKLHEFFWMVTCWTVYPNAASLTDLFAQAGITDTRVFELPSGMNHFFVYLRKLAKPVPCYIRDIVKRWKEGIAVFDSGKNDSEAKRWILAGAKTKDRLHFRVDGKDVGFRMVLLFLITTIEQLVPGDGIQLVKKKKGFFSTKSGQEEAEMHLGLAIKSGPEIALLWLQIIRKTKANWPGIHVALTEQRLQVPEGDHDQRAQWDECITYARVKMDQQANRLQRNQEKEQRKQMEHQSRYEGYLAQMRESQQQQQNPQQLQ